MTADIAMDSQRANVGGGEQFPVGRALNEFSLLKAGKENQRFAQDVQEPQQFRSQNVPSSNLVILELQSYFFST